MNINKRHFIKRHLCIFYVAVLVLTVLFGETGVKANQIIDGSQTVYRSDIVYDTESGYYVQTEITTYKYYDETVDCIVKKTQTVKDYYLYDGNSYIYIDSARTEENVYENPENPGATATPSVNPAPSCKPTWTPKPSPTPSIGPLPTPSFPGESTQKPTVKPTTKPVEKPTATPPVFAPTQTPFVISPHVDFDKGAMDIKAVRHSAKKAKITWKQNKKADGYYIYRATKEKGEYKLIKTIKDGSIVSYTDKKLKPKKEYYYKIQAYVYTLSGVLTTKMSKMNQVPLMKTQQLEYKLDVLQKEMPTGKYWNHVGYKISAGQPTYKYVTNKPCKNHNMNYTASAAEAVKNNITCNSFTVKFGKTKDGKSKWITGYQCYGFANYIGYRLFGDSKMSSHKSYKKAKVGDHVRINKHSMVIIEKYSDYIVVAECNVGGTCRISWGAKVRKSKLKNAVYYTKY